MSTVDSTGFEEAQGSTTQPDAPAPRASPNPVNVAAIAVSIALAVIFLVGLAIGVRCCIVRRRKAELEQQFDLEQQKKRELTASPDSTIYPTPRDVGVESRKSVDSVADSQHSSIWGETAAPSIAPRSSIGGDVWDSRMWPLPPGHSERYTFFSETSSIVGEATSDIGRRSIESRDEEANENDRGSAAKENRPNTGDERGADSVARPP
ncbi:hypothetical protein GGS23DRAFT_112446 [Durotheca rogersii]|uniref:uncharacterized protein n=1 Tax=Durotheca rogersii TaxID=419775 RepID=UPI00221FFF83|nr:uncharacterized protein GGS23DRAFT_112446 [Durotheca rogersii]KAI5862227.1 hypothetical protein GGS23DRAFT_112446 [Durotheca rogersii]